MTGLLLMAATVSAQGKQKTLTILHTSDTHSQILPLNAHLADTALAGRAGYLRRAALVKKKRAEHPDLLLLDCGDFSQGSPYYSIYKGEVEVGLMNMMGYDAATIGNHEFDYGLDNMARLFRLAKFPIVCANYDFTGTPVEGTVKPYIIIRRAGLKIGIFGVAPKIEGLVDSRNCRGVVYSDPAEKALETATYLKKKKHCDYVICLSHLGWKLGGQDDQYMISHSRNIDLVLGGHSHSYLKELMYVDNMDGKAVPVDHEGKHAVWVGEIIVSFK